MKVHKNRHFKRIIKNSFWIILVICSQNVYAEFTSLNIGLDYRLRGISIENNDFQSDTADHLNYYSHRARFYMTTWLNQDVEASLRLQSINIWGLEGSNTPMTRYPNADGTPWVEEAFIHMPRFAWEKIDLIVGRQPLIIGDGLLVSDDQLGFNAIRARTQLPQYSWFPWKIDVDIFTAKIQESLESGDDSDLLGMVLGTDRDKSRWEFSWIQERNDADTPYTLVNTTYTAARTFRQFYGIRLSSNLKDAYYKIEIALQSGDAVLQRTGQPDQNITLEGIGQKLELGAQTDSVKFGRFGVNAVYAVGSGDDAGTDNIDESFNPTFGKSWDGLQRTGYGTHYAATLSKAYDRDNPFGTGTSGLPLGYSGIKTMGLGIYSTQKVRWTGALNYYTFESRTKPLGKNDLGAELDAHITYRYTGFVVFKVGMALFFPGSVYGDTASRVTRYNLETHVHF